MYIRPNWIKERAECNISLVFKKLCAEIEIDVEEMRKYSSGVGRNRSFSTEKEPDWFKVCCDSDWEDKSFSVKFTVYKSDKCIKAEVIEVAPVSRAAWRFI